MITVNPDMIHDGEAATKTGYQYRVAYVQADLIREFLREASSTTASSLRYFSKPVTFDPDISQRLLYALRLFDRPHKPTNLLEAQSTFLQALADLFTRYAQPQYSPSRPGSNPGIIRRAREFMQDRISENLSLDDIAAAAGVSRFYFLRLFKASTGLSPHAYLVMRRLELAKALIRQGFSLAHAAYESGFADQSHMTRRFKAAYGFTPGQYQQAFQSR